MSRKERELKLAYAFKELGLISTTQLDAVLEQSQKSEKGIGQIMMQEVNATTMKDVFNYLNRDLKDIIKKKKKDSDTEKYKDLSTFSEQELEELFENEPELQKKLEKDLIVKDILNKKQLEDLKKISKDTSTTLGRVLINRKYLTPGQFSQMLRELHQDVTQASRENLLMGLITAQKIMTRKDLNKYQKTAHKENKELIRYLIEKELLKEEDIKTLIEGSFEPTIADQNSVKRELLNLIPVSLMKEKKLIPIKKKGKEITCLMEDIFDLSTIDLAGILTGCRIVPVQGDEENILTILNFFFPEEKEEIIQSSKEEDSVSEEIEEKMEENVMQLIENSSTVQLVATIIENAINARATDIHLEPQAQEMRVRFRIDGLLHDIMTIPKSLELPVLARIKILADMDVTERRKPQDGHYKFDIGEVSYDMRIATLPTYLGEKLVIRILDETKLLIGMPQLGFEETELEMIESLIQSPNGMILVTGPIGSGKTTTLYSSLNRLNIIHSNIVTVEDPVEYQLPGITQVQVDSKTGLSFASGLRAILRQDADVLMVGEIRDQETAEIAVRAALTGHLVLSTLHTNSAVGAIFTMKHLGINEYLVSSSIIGVIAQRLVRRICPHCKTECNYDPGVLKTLGLSTKKKYYMGKGCEHCFRTGYLGRVGIYEILKVNDQIKEMIITGKSEQDLKEAAIENGLQSLKINGIKAIEKGITTPAEIMKIIHL